MDQNVSRNFFDPLNSCFAKNTKNKIGSKGFLNASGAKKNRKERQMKIFVHCEGNKLPKNIYLQQIFL